MRYHISVHSHTPNERLIQGPTDNCRKWYGFIIKKSFNMGNVKDKTLPLSIPKQIKSLIAIKVTVPWSTNKGTISEVGAKQIVDVRPACLYQLPSLTLHKTYANFHTLVNDVEIFKRSVGSNLIYI